jgi:hypothetical protein
MVMSTEADPAKTKPSSSDKTNQLWLQRDRQKQAKMAPYDSDSDDGFDDPQDYTETDVLLGYVSKESKGETISRLGGQPVCPFACPSIEFPYANPPFSNS